MHVYATRRIPSWGPSACRGSLIGGAVLNIPISLAGTPLAIGLVDYVHNRTDVSDRLLIQSMGWEPRALPMV